MQSIVIRHLSGTKGNQVEEVSLDGFRDILIGREAHARIQYDAEREDLVSRNHASIVRDPADPDGFLLTDLDSRNGTAINNQRIFGASRLRHGDRVQLGLSGPEFSFELSPPPAARPTRLAELPLTTPPPVREMPAAPATAETSVWSFEGRIGRGTFWGTWLVLMLVGLAVGLIVGGLSASGGQALALLLYVAWMIVACWLSLAMQVKRWHDMDHSGLMVLWNFTIVAIPVLFIMLGCVPGTDGPNQYGSDPLRNA